MKRFQRRVEKVGGRTHCFRFKKRINELPRSRDIVLAYIHPELSDVSTILNPPYLQLAFDPGHENDVDV